MSDSRKAYRIPFFIAATLLYWASLYTYVPTFTAYLASMGASNKMSGLIVGSYGFVQMLLRIPVGILSDRFHKRRLFISLGLLVSLFSALGLLLAKSVILILIFRALAGAAAATWVDFTILYASYFRHDETSKAMGSINAYTTLGQTIAMLAGGYFSGLFGWGAPFAMAIGIAMIGFVISFKLFEKYDKHSEALNFKQVVNVAGNKTLLMVSGLAILSQVITFATVFGFTPLFADQQLHISKFDMGLLTVFSSLPSAFSAWLAGGIFTKWLGEKRVILLGFILTGLFTVSIPFTNSFVILLLTQTIASFGRGLSFPMLMSLSIKDVEPSRRATAMGFFQAIYGLGMFMGPVIMGIMGDAFDFKQGFIVLGILAFVTACLTLFLRNKSKKA